MTFTRLIATVWVVLSLSACVPGLAPKGTVHNPAGAKAPPEEITTPSGPQDEFLSNDPFSYDVPAPDTTAPRSLETPPPPSSDSPTPVPSPGGDGGGANYRENSMRVAEGGGFCPKPDQVILESRCAIKDVRALYGYGVWTEMPKTEPTSLYVGAGVPFDLYLGVQAYFDCQGCLYWNEPLASLTVRLVFRPAGSETYQYIDAVVQEKHADGYNTVFRNLTAQNGLIDVYAYENDLNAEGSAQCPLGFQTFAQKNWPSPLNYISFIYDSRAHYLGTFTTRVTANSTARDAMRQVSP